MTDDLFEQYINICNQALESNSDRFPFKQILNAAKNNDDSQNIEVCIIDDHPIPSHTIQLLNNQITEKKDTGCEKNCPTCQCQTQRQWRVPKSYLEDVINNPQSYIDNPAKLDWDWLYQDDQ